MSYLFKVENRVAKPNVETLLMSPFKEIWERDISEDKTRALTELTYIEFIVSVKQSNPYHGYTKDERERRIKKDIMLNEEYVPDELVLKAMRWLEDYQYDCSPTLRYYNSALRAADKLRHFFDDFNMTSLNPKTGNPMYKPKEITSALIDTEVAMQKLSAMKSKVQDEIFETVKNKGQKIVSTFANPETL